MPTVVGVKLRFSGKVLSFDPAGSDPQVGDHVVVSTERGQEYGEVVRAVQEVPERDLVAPLKPVLRVADEADRERDESLRTNEQQEMARFRALIRKHGLDMKPIGIEHLFDGSKVIFYFSADERVDFCELVREMAGEFHTRIDLRQIGVRDAARLLGGLGHCGEELCCTRFSGDFQPVSIRMAKDQDLPLNPLKNSGLCGRLMCCLRYESETYKEFKQRAPKCGTPVVLPEGEGKVVAINVPRESVTIRHQGGPDITVPLSSLDCSAGRGMPCTLAADALPSHATVAPTQRATPALRVAETSGEPAKVERQERSAEGEGREGQRRRRSGRKKPAVAAAASEAPKADETPKGDGQKEPRKRRPRRGTAQKKQAEGAESQPASAPEAPARRKRRRSHPREGASPSEGTE